MPGARRGGAAAQSATREEVIPMPYQAGSREQAQEYAIEAFAQIAQARRALEEAEAWLRTLNRVLQPQRRSAA